MLDENAEFMRLELEPAGIELPELEPAGIELLKLEPTGIVLHELEPAEIELPELEPAEIELPELEPAEIELPELEPAEIELPQLEVLKSEMLELSSDDELEKKTTVEFSAVSALNTNEFAPLRSLPLEISIFGSSADGLHPTHIVIAAKNTVRRKAFLFILFSFPAHKVLYNIFGLKPTYAILLLLRQINVSQNSSREEGFSEGFGISEAYSRKAVTLKL